MPDHETVEIPDLFFTSSSKDPKDLPPPFVSAGRSVLLTQSRIPKVLVLGYGLGSMAAVMLQKVPGSRIDGVEKSRDLFRRALREKPGQVDLHHEDASAYLRRTRRRFDLILDDCFELGKDDAIRTPRVEATQLIARLSPSGIVVRNLLVDDRHPLGPQIEDLTRHFESVCTRRFREWDNVLAVASQGPLDKKQVRGL